jgi:rubrerythrin
MEFIPVLLVLTLVVVFIIQPFSKRQRGNKKTASAEEHKHSSLLAERDRVIHSLQELDFDNVLGKVPAEEYPTQRAKLLARGADILRTLDDYSAKQKTSNPEKQIESMIAERRAETALNDDDIESLIAERRTAQKEKSGGFCPNCGRAVLRSDKFCPHCGKAIK